MSILANNYNVYLSGGGLKGIYQYSFFKQLYKLKPQFEIKRIYSASVGSLNATPILLKKVSLLEKYWESYDNSPFENIVEDYYEYNKNPKKLLSNIIKHKSVFKGIRESEIKSLWESLSEIELSIVRQKLHIITFDYRNIKESIHFNFNSQSDYFAAIKSSSAYPFLFPIPKNKLIDGGIVPFSSIKKYDESNYSNEYNDSSSNWLILDLGNCINTTTSNNTCYSPIIFNNMYSAIDLDKFQLHQLFNLGIEHANDFVSIISSR